jgi:N-methylhydantoinase A/oxoprolinase/acetone carboxylase beta subunit
VLCALGLAAAAPRRDVSRTVMLRGEALSAERLRDARSELLADALRALSGETEREHRPARVRVIHELRYAGQSFELAVEQSGDADAGALREAFAAAHEQRYGYRDESAAIELVNVRMSLWDDAPTLAPRADGDELAPGSRVDGPSVCALGDSTLYVPAGWSGVVDEHGTIVLEDGA